MAGPPLVGPARPSRCCMSGRGTGAPHRTGRHPRPRPGRDPPSAGCPATPDDHSRRHDGSRFDLLSVAPALPCRAAAPSTRGVAVSAAGREGPARRLCRRGSAALAKRPRERPVPRPPEGAPCQAPATLRRPCSPAGPRDLAVDVLQAFPSPDHPLGHARWLGQTPVVPGHPLPQLGAHGLEARQDSGQGAHPLPRASPRRRRASALVRARLAAIRGPNRGGGR